MKKVYFFLAVIGFILPNIFVAKVSIATGNILFWTKPLETMQGMFANDIATAFMLDLLFIVVLFLAWTYREARQLNIPRVWLIWVWTFAFGIASGLPLFLYFREDYLENEVGF